MTNCKFSANQNIADKYRIATDLSNAIKQLDYKADLGYQTFLYFNEKESRRLFLFLFDKLSKQRQDEPKQIKQSLLNRLKNIEINFKEKKEYDLNSIRWRTDDLDYLNFYMKNNQQNDPFHFADLAALIEWNTLNLNPNSKLFSKFFSKSQLSTDKKTKIDLLKLDDLDNFKRNETSPSKLAKKLIEQTASKDKDSDEHIQTLNDHLEQLEKQLESSRIKLKEKEDNLKEKQENLMILNGKFDAKKQELDRIKYSDRSNEELKDGIEKMKNEIKEVNKKWFTFTNEYDDLINELKDKKRSVIKKFNDLNEELVDTKNQIEINKLKLRKLDEQSKELEQNLAEDNDLDRKFYTKRIFEIINNVKKQEQDINKILEDIRRSQREINQLTGKVTRIYTVVEEIVLKNQADWSKKCYRLISELDEIYDKLINEIESFGQIKREILKFEDIVSSIFYHYLK